MVLDLRPLTLAELLDRSFSTYKRHLGVFVGIMAPPAALSTLYAIVMQVFTGSIQPTTPPDQVLATMVPILIASVVMSAVYMVVYAVALGATTIAVAQLYKNQPATVAASYREVRRHGWRLMLLLLWAVLRVGGAWLGLVMLTGILSAVVVFITPILSGLVFIAGMVVAAVLAVFLVIRYGVSVPAVVLENLSAGKALARSVELTEDHRGRVFLIMLCALMITYATLALLQGPFMIGAMFAGPGSATAIALTIAGAVLGGIGGMFSGPIMIIGLALVYYDIRIRKEALDLQMMLDALDVPAR